MRLILFILFIVMPFVEIALLIKLGDLARVLAHDRVSLW